MLILTHPHFFGRHIFHIHVMVLRRHREYPSGSIFLLKDSRLVLSASKEIFAFSVPLLTETLSTPQFFSPPSR